MHGSQVPTSVIVLTSSASHAEVFGSARSQRSFVPDQSLLSFSFGTDQSFLAHTVRELNAIVSDSRSATANSRVVS